MKTGLILEGGAVRGIFTAGVLDRLMESGIYYPYVIGVSAGGGNAMSYISRQKGRTAQLINAPRSEAYYGVKPLLSTGKLLDLDKMAFEYPFKQFPFDFDTYFGSETVAEYVCTCCETGEAEYFCDNGDRDRLLNVLKATCSLPMLCAPVELDGKHYLDGSISNSVPIDRAFEMGCDKVVIIMTKPDTNTPPTDWKKFRPIIHAMYKQFPAFEEACMTRTERYARNMELMSRMEAEGKAFVFRPRLPAIGKLERDSAKIAASYRDGYQLADARLNELLEWTGALVKAG